jgi:hypothetical protein
MIQSSSHTYEILMPNTYTKRTVRVTLDLICYEDLDLEDISWRELLHLQDDEDINISIKEYDIEY